MREFASGQIKKGVRTIGFGGDGATWGNYALVYRDAGGALLDAGQTQYTNGNTFSFTAVGFTTPKLWRDVAVYVLALSQRATDVQLALSSPGLGRGRPVHGDGANQALFLKAAMPLGGGFSVGMLLSYEVSLFDAATISGGEATVRYATQWRPSGGAGVTWQPADWILLGTRIVLNHDWEIRQDGQGRVEGLARSYEARLGATASPWHGLWIDVGATLLDRGNAIARKRTTAVSPNLGVEQAFLERTWVIRAGLDESAITAGFSFKAAPLNIDLAYLYNLGQARIGQLFGAVSHSLLTTITFDYVRFLSASHDSF